MKEQKYLFSIVMAVYNVEPFLSEAIESIIAQDIGFSNIQLILVDDGSEDGSGAICDEYAKKYPDNILALHKENGGVSSARNMGLEHIRGKYVNFMDSDDKLSPITLRSVYHFFEDHYNETDLVSISMKFFDGAHGNHILNYKFSKGTRVINLLKEWDAPQLSLSSAFTKGELFGELRFDTRLAHAEDAALVLKILSGKLTLGVVSKGIYWYRRRSSGPLSAVQNGINHRDYYLPYIRYFAEEGLRYYKEQFGQVPLFVQNTIAYHLQWRIMQEGVPYGLLSEDELNEYRSRLFSCFEDIDRAVIQKQRDIWTEHKFFIYRKKYKEALLPVRAGNDIVFLADGVKVYSLSQTIVKWEFVKIEKNECILEGRIFNLLPEFDVKSLKVEYCGTKYPCTVSPMEKASTCLGEKILEQLSFKVTLPLQSVGKMTLLSCEAGIEVPLTSWRFGKFFPVGTAYTKAYYYENGYVLQRKKSSFYIEKAGLRKRLSYELDFVKNAHKKKYPNLQEWKSVHKAILVRPLVALLKAVKRRPLWLISDRVTRADDNGIAFFMYMRQEHKEIDTRFVISKRCPDFKEVKKIGPTLSTDSIRYKINLLRADYVISSMAEDIVFNPFQGHSEPYRDLLSRTKFVFLQHGVTKDDISDWINRYSKNLYGFVTSGVPEYNSIINGKYYFDESTVWLTGFARFDRLKDNNQKQITIMPTWRKYLMKSYDNKAGRWEIGDNFTASDFYQFFNGLLNDSRLISAAKKYGYRIAFLPHPNLQNHSDIFTHGEDVQVLGSDAAYRDIFANSSLVISDYSSVIFDFAYLRKPVIYTHFDRESFFAGDHSYSQGYFDYERDGFGEVEYDLEGTVNRIIEYMENGCQLKEKYRSRIDNFFCFSDQKNCERIYKKIIELEK